MTDAAAITTLVSATLAVGSAISVAVIGARSARRVKIEETQAQRWREAESRNADKKYKTYEPILDLFQLLMDPYKAKEKLQSLGDEEIERRLDEFGKWIVIFGSGPAVGAYHDFKVAFFSLRVGAEPDYYWQFLPLLYRLYANFVIEVRYDIGANQSRGDIEAHHALGLGSFKLYESHLAEASRMPMRRLYKLYRQKYNWIPPWKIRNKPTGQGVKSLATGGGSDGDLEELLKRIESIKEGLTKSGESNVMRTGQATSE